MIMNNRKQMLFLKLQQRQRKLNLLVIIRLKVKRQRLKNKLKAMFLKGRMFTLDILINEMIKMRLIFQIDMISQQRGNGILKIQMIYVFKNYSLHRLKFNPKKKKRKNIKRKLDQMKKRLKPRDQKRIVITLRVTQKITIETS